MTPLVSIPRMTERQQQLLLGLYDREERVWLTGPSFRAAGALERLGLVDAHAGRHYGLTERGIRVVGALKARGS